MTNHLLNKNHVWCAFLIIISIALSLGLACAVPLVALSTIVAATLPRNYAVGMMILTVAINQCVGFGIQNYPTDIKTFMWGGVFFVTAIMCVEIARNVIFGIHMHIASKIVYAFLASFICYETLLFVASIVLGGIDNFSIKIQSEILLVNMFFLILYFITKQFFSAIKFDKSANNFSSR